jgi:diketogulonate reductase-like aldo/keto reductase
MAKLETLDGNAVARLGLGTWRMGESARSHVAEVDAVSAGLAMGYRLIDTAEMYGEGGAERVVGEALRAAAGSGVKRESLFVVSKVYPHNAGGEALARSCEASLRRLGLEQLDLYLLHWRGGVPLAETLAGMQALQRRRLIRHWGVSNFDVNDMQELFACAGGDGCAANQIYFSLGERGAAYALLPWLRQRDIAAMAYSPVDQGRLCSHRGLTKVAAELGVSAAQLALAWVLTEPGMMAIPKAVKDRHLRENLAAASITLSEETRTRLDALFPPPRSKTALAMT